MPPPRWLGQADGALAFWSFPAPSPRLHVLVSHGFGEHSGWWHHVALALQARGISAYLYDQYHHGRSAGAHGDAEGYDRFCAGLRLALEAGVAPLRRDGAPLLLLGHSNGGLIALLTLASLPPGQVAGLALSSPLLAVRPAGRMVGWLLARPLSLIDPKLPVPLPVRPWRLTGLAALWPSYRADPLRFHTISTRFFLAMGRATRKARREVTRLEMPLLLLSAGEEQVVSAQAMQAWYEGVQAPAKERIVYPGLHHELFNEAAWERVLEDVLRWSERRLEPPAQPLEALAGGK
jgi:lysophospholipase